DFIFIRPAEILAFNDALPAFTAINTVPVTSTDSQDSHFGWATSPHKHCSLGPDLKLPLLADRNTSISRDYSILIKDKGIALHGLFITDPNSILRCAHSAAVSTPFVLQHDLIVP
ncbi:uncharacterized protein BXZ73DRAFT_54759, partial [Epithele typhae]|uniref:uncharacterized protein n=1 Tax=Epithele typhae TaxID=378194 RepID=UPI0020081368